MKIKTQIQTEASKDCNQQFEKLISPKKKKQFKK